MGGWADNDAPRDEVIYWLCTHVGLLYASKQLIIDTSQSTQEP